MNCSICNDKFDCIKKLPVILQTGETICQICYASSKNVNGGNIVYNKHLIKLMGYCSEHIYTRLNLFCLEENKRMCEKCVMYGNKSVSLGSKSFIEISKINQEILQKNGQIQRKRSNIDILKNKIENIFVEYKQKCSQKIEKQYENILLQLNQNKRQIYEKIENKINQLKNTTVKKSQEQYEKTLKNLVNKKCNNNQTKLIHRINVLENFTTIQKKLQEECSKIESIVCDLSKQFKFSFKNFNSELNDSQIFNLSLSEIGNQVTQEQSLLQELQEHDDEKSVAISWTKFEQDTQIASNNSIISAPLIASMASTTNLRTNKKKPTLKLKSLTQIKINSSIKEIDASNLNISNLEAKKLLQKTKNSFTEILNIQNNKINSHFIRDLSKVQIGKYLKVIKMSSNKIDFNDPRIKEKIVKLGRQGVRISLY